MSTTDVPPGIDMNSNDAPAMLGTVIATWLLLLLAFGGRLACRKILRMSLLLDDRLIIPAVVLATLEALLIIAYMIPNNLGKHIFAVPEEQREQTLFSLRLSVFISQQSWTLGVLSVKGSILAFYWRIFSTNKFVRYQIMFWGVVVVCWFIESAILRLAGCKPLRGLWDKSVTTECTVIMRHVILYNTVINTVTDAALLVIPLPAIWALRLGTKQKIELTGIFLVGLLCTATSITRLVYIDKTFPGLTTSIEDVSWHLRWTTTLTSLELNIAVICACLPQLRPLLSSRSATTRYPTPSHFSTSRCPTVIKNQPVELKSRTLSQAEQGGLRGDEPSLELSSMVEGSEAQGRDKDEQDGKSLSLPETPTREQSGRSESAQGLIVPTDT